LRRRSARPARLARETSDAGSSLAQEFKKSGATAVWSYGQKVDAAEASSAAVKFLENIRAGKTLLESFRSLSRDSAVKAGPEAHLKVELKHRFIQSTTLVFLLHCFGAIS
jgi:hypothetical protein